ncbi:hypothetical protein E2320_005430, partial [Naja naja]
MDDLNADDFLNSIENLLQRWMEIFFVTGHPQQEKIVFILLHDNYYHAIKNIKGFLGERY